MNVPQYLLADIVERLRRDLRKKPFDALTCAFRSWLGDEHVGVNEVERARQEASAGTQTRHSYRDVAALGFLYSDVRADDDLTRILSNGLDWVSEREAMSPIGEYQSFTHDPLALLGIAVAATVAQEKRAAVQTWMGSFLPGAIQRGRCPDWKLTLYEATMSVLGISFAPGPALKAPDFAIVLRNAGIAPWGPPASEEELPRAALDEIRRLGTAKSDEPVRVAVAVAAYEALMAESSVLALGPPDVSHIVEVLRGVGAGLRRWTFEDRPRTTGSRQAVWHIDNEYHVQNLLYAVLSPYLAGLKDEEYLPSLGQKKPRADLAYLPLRLIIEVKFMRSATDFAAIVGEISQDVGLYLKPGSGFDQIVAFVWDDARRTQEHALFTSGLKEIRGVTDAIVISRPSHMGAPQSAKSRRRIRTADTSLP